VFGVVCESRRRVALAGRSDRVADGVSTRGAARGARGQTALWCSVAWNSIAPVAPLHFGVSRSGVRGDRASADARSSSMAGIWLSSAEATASAPTRTTLPRSSAGVSGDESSQRVARRKLGGDPRRAMRPCADGGARRRGSRQRPPATRSLAARPRSDQLRPTCHGKRRSSSARAWTADSPKRRAHRVSRSSLSRKNFQSLITVCLTNRNGAGDWNGRKLEL
jgi:hypothetical protein